MYSIDSCILVFRFWPFSQNDIFTVFQICGKSPEKSYKDKMLRFSLHTDASWFCAMSDFELNHKCLRDHIVGVTNKKII